MSDDQVFQEELDGAIGVYYALIARKAAVERFKLRQLAELEERHGDDIREIQDLESRLEEVRERVNKAIHEKALLEDRRKFFNDRLSTSLRKRAGYYDPDQLYAWATQFAALLSNPVNLQDLIQLASNEANDDMVDNLIAVVGWLKQKHPNLIVNEKAAVKLATETRKDGTRIYDGAPVEIETYATQVSADQFAKVIATYAIETGQDNPEEAQSLESRRQRLQVKESLVEEKQPSRKRKAVTSRPIRKGVSGRKKVQVPPG